MNAHQISYGTVRDFCESCDIYPTLSHLQGDLKDLQRPAALKQIGEKCKPGASLLEIGAGTPHVARALNQIGYRVTIVDPYDGSAGGPEDYDEVRLKYPDLTIVRDRLGPGLQGLPDAAFDCIYSISVLEHVHEPHLSDVFAGVRRFLKPGGWSLHLVDHVIAGLTAEFHLQHLQGIVRMQAQIARQSGDYAIQTLTGTLAAMAADVDTYYLSAEAHNMWRGKTPYDQFPYRKVGSVHTAAMYVS